MEASAKFPKFSQVDFPGSLEVSPALSAQRPSLRRTLPIMVPNGPLFSRSPLVKKPHLRTIRRADYYLSFSGGKPFQTHPPFPGLSPPCSRLPSSRVRLPGFRSVCENINPWRSTALLFLLRHSNGVVCFKGLGYFPPRQRFSPGCGALGLPSELAWIRPPFFVNFYGSRLLVRVETFFPHPK